MSWPLEPEPYDLLVELRSELIRVQVKTTTSREGSSWEVFLSRSGRVRRTNGPGEVDEFFIVDGGMGLYRIPAADVGGVHAINLNAYANYCVGKFALQGKAGTVADPR